MYPVLFRFGHLTVSTYGVLVATAFLVAGWIGRRALDERGLDGGEAWSLLFYALIGGMAGGKLYYAALHADLSSLVSRAGFVWYGGLIGGSLAVLWAVRRKGLPLGTTADAVAPALPLGHAIGHVGCFFSGDSYGLPSGLPWAVAFPRGAPPSTAGALRSEFGVELPARIPDSELLRVHPTMLYSALALTLVFLILWSLRRKRSPAGTLFGLYLVLSGLERFLVEFIRAKDDRVLWGFTTAQVIAALAIAGGVALVVTLRRRWRAPIPAGAAVPAVEP